MKKLIVILASIILLSLPVQATLITLSPSSTIVQLGSSFTLDVDVSDIDTTNGEVLALFELLIGFDNSIFALNNIAFGSSLDGGIFGDSDQFIDPEPLDPTSATTVFENTFLDLAELQALQMGSFTILTFTFDAIALSPGSDLTVDIIPFGFLDFDGFDLTVNPNNQGSILPATIAVIEQTVVPEPASIILWLVPLLGLLRKAKFQVLK